MVQLAGGGDSPIYDQQQQIQIPLTPPDPPKDHALLWATGVFVPVLVALIAVWARRNK